MTTYRKLFKNLAVLDIYSHKPQNAASLFLLNFTIPALLKSSLFTCIDLRDSIPE